MEENRGEDDCVKPICFKNAGNISIITILKNLYLEKSVVISKVKMIYERC